ncbi:phage tail tape measure protein [Psychrobacter lutiphocae]|uniref:phage tail tape measure protein n=1 Tax=Psychrobacter lutiphocae TaxID=540500 RepID=UPI00037BA6F8|nr:phage tail tape measure protein [Psychrobacter lutiphocae]
MASNLVLSLSIGALVSGTFSTAMANTSNTIKKLDVQTNQLSAKQQRLGSALSTGMSRPHASMSKLHNQYLKIGRVIESNRNAQERLNASIAKAERLKTGRADLRSSAMETIGTGAAFAAPFIASAKAAINFESAMAEVNKTVDFSAGNSIGKLGDELKQLSLQIPLTANELASIAASGGQLGVADTELIGFTETIAKMGVAFDMSAGEAGDSMAKLANVYKIPIAQMSEVGDAINELSNSSPAKANEIVNTLGRVGGLAQQFGLTVNEATALSGAFIALGKSPEVAATAINGMITTLSTLDPTNKKQAGVFKQMGLDMTEFQNLVKTDGQAAINTLLQHIEKIPEADRIGALTGLFGREYADDIAALSGGIDTYTAQLQTLQAVDEQGNPQYIGSMAKEFASISGTTENKFALFKNNLTVLAITIGDALLPAINEALLAVAPFIQKFTELAKNNPQVIKSIALLVGGLFAGKLGFIGARYGINLFFTALNSLAMPINLITGKWSLLRGMTALGLKPKGLVSFIGSMRRLSRVIITVSRIIGGAGLRGLLRLGSGLLRLGRIVRVVGMMFMSNPILIAVALIAGAAFLIYKNWDRVGPYFSKLWNSLKTFAKSGVGNILRTIASFTPLGLFIRAWTAVFGYFSGLTTKFRQYGINIIQGLIGGITAKFGALKAKMSEMASSVAGVFSGKLEINSPSKLFTRIAHSIPEGIGLGVTNKAGIALGAIRNLSKRIGGSEIESPKVTEMDNRLAQTEYSNKVLGNRSLSGGGMSAGSIQFSPTINVQVSADNNNVSAQVQTGLSASYAQFERMLAQVEANRQRRAFA